MEEEKSAKHPSDKDISIGLVDDHSSFTGPLAAMLNRQPRTHVLWQAENGLIMQQQILALGVPHMVLMDVEMAGMNGYRSSEWLQRHHPEVRVLVLTGFANAEVDARMALYGVCGLVSKMSGYDEIYLAILQVADLGHYRTQPHLEKLEDAAIWALQHGARLLKNSRQQFLELCCEDLNREEIAQEMNIAPATVDNYFEQHYQEFNVHSRHALVAKAFRQGLLS